MKPKISCLKTKIILLLSNILIIVAGNPSLVTRIVNGRDSTIEEFPYQVSIRWNGYHRCGGAIVTAFHVITAAHCLYPYTNSNIKDSFNVMAGSENLFKLQEFSIANSASHEKYGSQMGDFDIALITLADKLPFSSKINAIGLPPQNYNLTDELAIISGWGYKQEDGEMSTILQSAKVKIIPREICEKNYPKLITENMICAGLKREDNSIVDSCQGDSGGPMVQGGYLIGIVSRGLGCARPFAPGVYTYVPNFRQWIIERLDK